VTSRPDIDLAAFSDVRPFLSAGRELDPRPYLGVAVSPSIFASLMAFLSPRFVEYRGGVFLGFAFNQVVIDDWFARLDDVGDVERIVNHVHVWDLLPSNGFVEAEAQLLVEPMAWFWRMALRGEFPDRTFVVAATADGSYGPELTFSQADE